MSKCIKTRELFNCRIPYLKELFEKCEYPWEILHHINAHARKIIQNPPSCFRLFAPDVLVGKDVEIHPLATVTGPCVIGHSTMVRPGAFIRGNVITGENCVIGNSSELKNCILLDKVQIPHYNYIGDSILGNNSHTGAGAVCSNLKSDKSDVFIHADEDIETGLRKIGGILADGADIGCGCVLNPGTVIGKNTSVYPLISVRGVIESDCIVKAMNNIIKRR